MEATSLFWFWLYERNNNENLDLNSKSYSTNTLRLKSSGQMKSPDRLLSSPPSPQIAG
jgi:hypothetical protein